jgi:four helix bundle protein
MFRFEKLEVWQKAITLADDVYDATSSYPSDERFGLVSQMRRAAVSISSNIAEGSSRSSDTDFGRFLEIAYGSLMELVSQSFIAKRREFMVSAKYDALYRECQELSRMLSGLRGSLHPRL